MGLEGYEDEDILYLRLVGCIDNSIEEDINVTPASILGILDMVKEEVRGKIEEASEGPDEEVDDDDIDEADWWKSGESN